MEGTMAVVTCFAGDFAPKNWALCNGQILPIASNQALFALIGTTYGGNGTNTFALPDLRGRTPVSVGKGSGLANYTLGEVTGNETVSLLPNHLPPHNHNGVITLQLDADSNDGSVTRAVNTYPGGAANSYNATADTTMAAPQYAVTIGVAGNSIPVPVHMPYLALNYIICTAGLFPSRN